MKIYTDGTSVFAITGVNVIDLANRQKKLVAVGEFEK
jgi:hypothetical protein